MKLCAFWLVWLHRYITLLKPNLFPLTRPHSYPSSTSSYPSYKAQAWNREISFQDFTGHMNRGLKSKGRVEIHLLLSIFLLWSRNRYSARKKNILFSRTNRLTRVHIMRAIAARRFNVGIRCLWSCHSTLMITFQCRRWKPGPVPGLRGLGRERSQKSPRQNIRRLSPLRPAAHLVDVELRVVAAAVVAEMDDWDTRPIRSVRLWVHYESTERERAGAEEEAREKERAYKSMLSFRIQSCTNSFRQ